MNDQTKVNDESRAEGQSLLNDGLGVQETTLSPPGRGVDFFLGNEPVSLCDGEGEEDASGGIFKVGGLWFWEYLQLLKNLDPVTRRDILGLHASNFFLKLRIFRLECRDKFSQLRIFTLECQRGLRRFPRFHLVTPNVELRGDALLRRPS